MSDDGFPPEILSKSVEERLQYFETVTIAHPILMNVYNKVCEAILHRSQESVICIIGPTGAGKSTLLRRIIIKIVEMLSKELAADPNRVPFIALEAVGPHVKEFNWRDYYFRCLVKLKEPGIDQKASVTRLRFLLENSLEHRNLLAVLVDEAQHMTIIPSGDKLKLYLDCIKSLSNMGKTRHVLAGTYELVHFMNLSGQLERRTMDIHFRRYRADNQDDFRAFRNIISSLQRKLPVREEPDLVQYSDFLYERSVGCVGLLQPWLHSALKECLNEECHTISFRHLEVTAKTVRACDVIAGEAIEGEEAFCENPKARNDLRQRLKLPAIPGHLNSEKTSGVTKPEGESVRKRRQRVGERSPKRDPVGRQEMYDI